jgi:hypothetical protein
VVRKSETARKTNPAQPTSVAERKWYDMVRQVARVKTAFETMHQDQHRFADFYGAADELATFRFGVYPPHVDPETVGVPPLPNDTAGGELDIWPIDKAFTEALRSLDWLAKVSELAGIRAAADKQKAGAPSPDKAAHIFVRSLATFSRMPPVSIPTNQDMTACKTSGVGFSLILQRLLLPPLTLAVLAQQSRA